jgi:hypothetical protein
VEIAPHDDAAWDGLCGSYVSLSASAAMSGDEETLLATLRSAFSCWKHLKEQGPIMELLGTIFRYLVEDQKLPTLRAAYREVESMGPQELRDFLSPYGVLLRYLDTRDHEIIDRLRPEERTIIEEMLKVAEAKPHHDKKAGPASKSRKRR